MKCLHPLTIPNKKFCEQSELYLKGSLGYRPSRYIDVPCGKCEACLSLKRQQWFFRLYYEREHSKNSYFIGLTYDDEHLPKDLRLNKRDVQLFLKRLRKHIQPYKIRYFLVGEYGEDFGRPHYHLILFNWPDGYDLAKALKKCWDLCDPVRFDDSRSIQPLINARINYVCKYCLSTIDSDDPSAKTFMLCSRKPGIGFSYLTPAMVRHLQDQCDGMGFVEFHHVPLPRYYKEKVYDDEMKLNLSYHNYLRNEYDLDKYFKNNYSSDRKRVEPLWSQQQRIKKSKIRKTVKNGFKDEHI